MRGIELRSGVKGVFKISIDGEVVFDKAVSGHLPGAGEAARSVEGRLGQNLRWRKPHTV
jgi:predicted Rdx family selenoprotein